MSSFDDAILQEPERFIGYAFGDNPHITDFGEFKNSLNRGIDHAKGDIDEQTIIDLFENTKTKELIKDNVSKEEYERLYGDGKIVQRVPISSSKMVVVSTPKLKVTSHTRAGKPIKSYNRGFTRWTPAEAKFLQIRKTRKLTPSQVIREYNKHFSKNPRTPSSIKTKLYRL